MADRLEQSSGGLVERWWNCDCQLVSDIGPRRLRLSDSGFCAMRRSRPYLRRPVFCCRRPTSGTPCQPN